jgi:hypothetical protein
VAEFVRYGKAQRPRIVYVALELARGHRSVPAGRAFPGHPTARTSSASGSSSGPKVTDMEIASFMLSVIAALAPGIIPCLLAPPAEGDLELHLVRPRRRRPGGGHRDGPRRRGGIAVGRPADCSSVCAGPVPGLHRRQDRHRVRRSAGRAGCERRVGLAEPLTIRHPRSARMRLHAICFP